MKIKPLCENHLYAKAYSKGKRAVSPALAVHLLPDYKAKIIMKEDPRRIFVNRVGLTVGKKIGGAVERSRAKRIMRAAYMEVTERNVVKRGFIIVIVAREGIIGMKSDELARQLEYNFVRLGLITGKKE